MQTPSAQFEAICQGAGDFGQLRYMRQAEPHPSTILVVDGSFISRQTLRATLKTLGHSLLEAGSAGEAQKILAAEKVDLVLVDLMIPDIGGPGFCGVLKSDPRTKLIPIFILANEPDITHEIAGISSGADEFLIKPLHPQVVRARVQAMLRHKELLDSLDETEAILFSVAQSVEERDRSTGQHCERIARLSTRLGQTLGLPEEDLVTLQRAGYLHDIGKISIPDKILFKPGKLTGEEWAVMKEHPVRGENICRKLRSLASVLPLIRHHHERWDGSGYPDGLAGHQIPLLAQILQLADIFDALTMKRSYKRAYSAQDAIALIEDEARIGWRNTELVKVFAQLIHPVAAPETQWDNPTAQSLAALVRSLQQPQARNGKRQAAHRLPVAAS